MDGFTPASSAMGGALIGAAAVALWLGVGRIMGISGIVGGILASMAGGEKHDLGWRAAFLVGLLAAPILVDTVGGIVEPAPSDAPALVLIAAGLLVGFGTRLGAGCTSGHGVCGLARASKRSVVATSLFMTTAVAVVFITRHVLGA
ncbi:YeeE/YedE family protein [Skermanella stibiiresistens SB22]|uniref:YeeE/YedE family protein n=1 Tax=Skermanella stibiiresistens SB22 TaxID=1385369 RepID=W9HBW3_9PROT|nr:YeeE/YedE thiosulfate transporter family protein [Skermanella stibiiresistens]EWY42211.1 YeeE/YedE family protein [Skermanella stibiiresistens SB22]